MSNTIHDIIIVGAGPAGLTAAVYALRAGKTALVIEKGTFGGQIASSPKVENIPGTKEISGIAFADALVDQAVSLGADVELENVIRIEKHETTYTVHTEEGTAHEGKTVILATGVKHRKLGLDGEEDLIGNGISFCAVCDGAFYAGQDVVMVGGGNSALQEALLLAEVCRHVTIVQNLPTFTGEPKLAQALLTRENVTVHFSTLVTGYVTEDAVLCGVAVQSEQGETRIIPADGVFLAVGLVPENGAFAELAATNAWGYFDSAEDCETQTPGIFVAGDCRSKRIRQVVTASADGATAAMAAVRYLDQL